MLFTLFMARNIVLKAKMLMKKRVCSSNRFDRSNPSKRPYNETSRFGLIEKGKTGQPSRPTPMRPNITSFDKTLGKQVEMNKPNNHHAKL